MNPQQIPSRTQVNGHLAVAIVAFVAGLVLAIWYYVLFTGKDTTPLFSIPVVILSAAAAVTSWTNIQRHAYLKCLRKQSQPNMSSR